MEWKPPSESDFNANWMTPREWDTMRSKGDLSQRRWLHDRLRGGIAIAVARSWFDSTYSPARSFAVVPRSVWADWNYNDSDFWLHGTLRYAAHVDMSGDTVNEYTYLDVRIDPNSLSSTPPPLAPSFAIDVPQAAADTNKKVISEQLLKKWAELFQEAYPNGNQPQAQRSFDGMFPDRSVTRERLRRILPSQPRGKPKQNND